MQLVSSDTNVLLDFFFIGHLDYPFRLAFSYLVNSDTFHEEFINPPHLADTLVSLGISITDLEADELFMAASFHRKYRKLSIHDRMALAIAKNRRIPLLTGDLALRKAAKNEAVKAIGTIGICDLLLQQDCLTESEYIDCMKSFLRENGQRIRLPENELRLRIESPAAAMDNKVLEEQPV